MALINDYRLLLEIHDQKGKIHHQFEVENLVNCVEDLKFSALSQGRVENDGIELCVGFEPIWESVGASPYCSGFRLTLKNGKAAYAKSYAKNVFRYQIYRAVKQGLNNIKLDEGVKLEYKLACFPKGQLATSDQSQALAQQVSVDAIHEPLPISGLNMPLSLATTHQTSEDEIEVFVADHVVTEMIEYVLQNKERERAGFLIGHLGRNPETKRLFLVCRDQFIANFEDSRSFATENASSMLHFQFPPEMFLEVQRVIELRKQNEIVLGWYHSHPWPFACSKGRECECTSVFFSAADFDVMEAAFRAPYQVAIVIGRATRENMEASAQLYGWKDGLVVPREFNRFDTKPK